MTSCADAYASATEILLICTFFVVYLIHLNDVKWDVYIEVTGAAVQSFRRMLYLMLYRYITLRWG